MKSAVCLLLALVCCIFCAELRAENPLTVEAFRSDYEIAPGNRGIVPVVDQSLRDFNPDEYSADPKVFILSFHEVPAIDLLPDGAQTPADLINVQNYIGSLKQLHQSYISQIEAALPGFSTRIRSQYYRVSNGLSFLGNEADARTLRGLAFIASVRKSNRIRAYLNQSVPHIGVPPLWEQQPPVDGSGMRIGIIDTGVDYTHDDLGGCQHIGPGCRVSAGWDFVNNDPDPMDDFGHGTHVAAVAASSHANFKGVAPAA